MKGLKPLFTWRSSIAESGLAPSARLVALTLSLHMSERGEKAFPSLETLAEETGLGRSTVTRQLKVLEHQGYLSRQPGGGRGHPTVYTAQIPSHSETVPEENRFIEPEEQSDGGTVTPINSPTVGREDVKLLRKARGRNTYSPTFLRFWAAYPRKAAKPKAAEAFDRAVCREAPDRIIEAAHRFAADPNRDPAFTAHPATWLNQDRWLDEPLPARNGHKEHPLDAQFKRLVGEVNRDSRAGRAGGDETGRELPALPGQ